MKALIPMLFCLAATVLLVLATITAPIKQSLYFLEATVSSHTFYLGALGYCVGSTCSNVSVGYNIADASTLLGTSSSNEFESAISKVATSILKGLTYTLVLHPVAAGLAAVAMLLAILSFCAVGMGCLGTFVAGVATTVTIAAFAIDLALFTIIKKRVVDDGGTATYGTALWFVLAAFICLILAQFAFCCACCGSRGGGGGGRKRKDRSDDPLPDSSYGDRMRMDAMEAEAARKARANGDGTGRLPQFAEYEHEMPLKNDYDDPYHGNNRQSAMTGHGVGYAYDGVDSTYQGQNGGYNTQHNLGNQGTSDYDGYGNRGGDSSYVSGVGQGYGNGAGVGAGAAAGGLAANHYAHDHSQGGYHDYADNGQGQVGHGGSEYYDQYAPEHQGGYDAQQQQDHYDANSAMNGQHEYAPSVTSGYAVGGPTHMAMPQPVTGRGMNSSDPRRRPTDDGFGVSALEASAAAAAGGAAYGHSQYHHGSSSEASNNNNNAAYYDAPTHGDEYSDAQGGGYQQYGNAQHPEEWQHSTRTNEFPQAGTADGSGQAAAAAAEAPSYDYAIGAISPDEERARSAMGSSPYGAGGGAGAGAGAGGGYGGGSSSYQAVTAQRGASRGPLPVPGATTDSGAYPREKY